jgi:hypothetical protein
MEKKERQEYISKMFKCKNGDCENCGVCALFRGRSPEDVFKDYIEGKKDFDEIYSKYKRW